MAMRSRSMARSQCWTTVLIRTGSLSAPDVNSTGNSQPTEKACCGIPTRVHPHLSGLTLKRPKRLGHQVKVITEAYVLYSVEDG